MKSDGLEIKASGQVDSSHDVLESRHDARRHLTVLCIGSSRRRRNTVRIFGDLLSVLLSGRCSQVEVRALGVGERSRSNELRANVRTSLTNGKHHESLPSEPVRRWTGEKSGSLDP